LQPLVQAQSVGHLVQAQALSTLAWAMQHMEVQGRKVPQLQQQSLMYRRRQQWSHSQSWKYSVKLTERHALQEYSKQRSNRRAQAQLSLT
jgi:hypothetical protein